MQRSWYQLITAQRIFLCLKYSLAVTLLWFFFLLSEWVKTGTDLAAAVESETTSRKTRFSSCLNRKWLFKCTFFPAFNVSHFYQYWEHVSGRTPFNIKTYKWEYLWCCLTLSRVRAPWVANPSKTVSNMNKSAYGAALMGNSFRSTVNELSVAQAEKESYWPTSWRGAWSSVLTFGFRVICALCCCQTDAAPGALAMRYL